MAKHRQCSLGTADTQEKWTLPSHYHFDAFMQRGVSVKTIDFYLNF